MKHYSLILAASAIALASCSSDENLGNPDGPSAGSAAIAFTSGTNGTTRATHVGADAASMLGSNFVVEGWKTTTTATSVWGDNSSVVFDNYNVNFTNNSAGTTESNTSDWEYVAQAKNSLSGVSSQTIKYWDHSTLQYDFYAYSLGNDAANKATVTQETPGTATTTTIATAAQATGNARAFVEGKGGAYTLTGSIAALGNAYISDLVTVPNANYDNEVMLTFRNLGAKVRFAFYETVPGYSVRDVEFYNASGATTKVTDDKVTLYSASNTIYSDGTYTVYFPTVDKNGTDTDNNKAHVVFAPSTSGSSTILSMTNALSYQREQASTLEDGEKYLGIASNTATYTTADKADAYQKVLPNENATALTLRCNYTLVSDDGSKEVIKVWGATAVIPAIYCQWKSNYAYTYIFKISDNTNGSTASLGGTSVGLHPITFDAVTVDPVDGNQETVTTVATPSITTYEEGVNPTVNNEYTAGTIYAMVQNGTDVKTLASTDTYLYTLDAAHASATEAEVIDALNMRTSGDAATIVGRNSVTLTPATITEFTTTISKGVDGNDITLTSGNAAKFTVATGTYAFVYKVADGGTSTEVYSAVSVAKDASLKGYYTASWDETNKKVVYTACADSDVAAEAGVYYQKFTKNDVTYAVKVIKVVA